ncbi:CPBP family glutamic-type intramembrane protease [Schleiferilactobacillus perolens]|uniref:CAAX prenyl protease 2/Lysostaphin resistance protein A-like domain-containing protein n=1 Tax=Schleiferilactobacillus perolens DSM 12744 TaxID=1423792 RepID=A0A0R1N669_9LACO|nr:CPBP family glutamic-type intramembrane protease [Schleiferilactobacillus perolens]KRL11704.1 hypothetical protein FD09_GL000628 [Schleiferilactobacillus perolens DSM 12744]MCI2172159.1 CPBP family glutamic-type intramembrane protease [Schleiferilactobacillus perolens]
MIKARTQGYLWTQFLILAILYGGLMWYQFTFVLVKNPPMPALAIYVGAAVILAIVALVWTNPTPAAGADSFFAAKVYWPLIGVMLVITAARFGMAYLHFSASFPVMPIQQATHDLPVAARLTVTGVAALVLPLIEQTLFTRLWFNGLWTNRHYAMLTVAILISGVIQGLLYAPEIAITTGIAVGIGCFIAFLGGITQNYWAAVVAQALSNFLLVFIF